MVYATLYLDRDNTIDLLLYSDGQPVSLASVTKMELIIGTTTVTSNNAVGDPILWNQLGYRTGKVVMKLGAVDLEVGVYDRCSLILYDVANPNGLVWDILKIAVVETVAET